MTVLATATSLRGPLSWAGCDHYGTNLADWPLICWRSQLLSGMEQGDVQICIVRKLVGIDFASGRFAFVQWSFGWVCLWLLAYIYHVATQLTELSSSSFYI